jgi:predicted SnoaL-like aldol condensation-catalyzing enzyme
MNSLSMENKQIVLDYFDLTFNQHKPAESARMFLSVDYVHHGPGCGSGREEFILFFSNFFTEKPSFRAHVLHCIAENNYVALRVQTQDNPLANKSAVAEFYRLEDKKIIEHWHVF